MNKKSIDIIFAGLFSVISLAAAAGNTLPSSSELFPGQSIVSSAGKYHLIMQGDGNLVYYRASDNLPRWNSATDGRGARAAMQGDGNFVVYTSNNSAVWNSGTDRNAGASITAQDDGNLVIYLNGRALWNIGTDPANDSPQSAGDVVLRDLSVPLLGAAFGHIGLWDGANVIEMLNEPGGSSVKYNTLENFKSRSTYQGKGSPNVPHYNSIGCYDSSYCGKGSYVTVSARVAIVKRAFQIYGIGADYTLAAQYTPASAKAYGGSPTAPNIPGKRGLYRCDTFIVDVFSPGNSMQPYLGPSGEQIPPSGSAVERWFNFTQNALRSTLLPTVVFNKLKGYSS